jgi:hypothetical protein
MLNRYRTLAQYISMTCRSVRLLSFFLRYVEQNVFSFHYMISHPPLGFKSIFFFFVSQYFLLSRPVTFFSTSRQRNPNPCKTTNKNTALKIAWMTRHIIRMKTLYVCVCGCVHTRTHFFLLHLFLEPHIYLLVDLIFSRWLTVTRVVLRNITLCSLMGFYRRFDITCWLCLQVRRLLLCEYMPRKNAWECHSEEYICTYNIQCNKKMKKLHN